MKKILFILLLNATFGFSQNGWIAQNSGITSNINCVRFLGTQTGWCVGDLGKILKTSNGGSNWTLEALGTSVDFKDITFTSSQIGYIVGKVGLIFKTTNAGNSWLDISFNSNILNTVFFVDDSLGYVGGANYIYRTTNGGTIWDSCFIPGSWFSNSIYFINETTGWASGALFSSDAIYKTTNGGVNWFQQRYQGDDKIRCVFFIDSSLGFCGSPENIAPPIIPSIHYTKNGGYNWTSVTGITGFESYSIFFTDVNNGWTVGSDGTMSHSVDSGKTWINQKPFDTESIYRSVFFIDHYIGWCVGDSGRILKTTTGGLTFAGNSNLRIPENYFLSQNYPNPFNPTTTLKFGMKDFGFVSLKIYDALGKDIRILISENKSPGSYEVQFDADDLPSGLYLYRLEIDYNTVTTKRMVLLK